MTKNFLMSTVLLLSLTLTATLANAKSQNLLQNPTADQETRHWRAMGEATVESTTTNNRCFVLRNGGKFYQDVDLPGDAAGQYTVLIGRGSSERNNPDGAITGLPYLYGYMMAEISLNICKVNECSVQQGTEMSGLICGAYFAFLKAPGKSDSS